MVALGMAEVEASVEVVVVVVAAAEKVVVVVYLQKGSFHLRVVAAAVTPTVLEMFHRAVVKGQHGLPVVRSLQRRHHQNRVHLRWMDPSLLRRKMMVRKVGLLGRGRVDEVQSFRHRRNHYLQRKVVQTTKDHYLHCRYYSPSPQINLRHYYRQGERVDLPEGLQSTVDHRTAEAGRLYYYPYSPTIYTYPCAAVIVVAHEPHENSYCYCSRPNLKL